MSRPISLSFALAMLCTVPSVAVQAKDSDGVKIGHSSYVGRLVPASIVENQAVQQYDQLVRQARQKGALLSDSDRDLIRLKRIQQDLLPHSYKFNERAKAWKWEVNGIRSNTLNAFCMPGGKIAFFSGIIDKLQLSDDEIAMIMGHEIAHALREHARERMAKSAITNYGSQIIGAILFGQAGQYLGAQAGGLLTLKFSRDDETEADLIGMELAARAGYDPRSGLTLWKKMAEAAKGAPPAWFSSHPSSAARIKKIEATLPDVMPLYEAAKGNRQN